MSGENIERGRARALRTARLEAFSDGVFAIAITLLVLEISVPVGCGLGIFQPVAAVLGYLAIAVFYLIPIRPLRRHS